MGRAVQKRIVRKLDLEMLLSKITANPLPNASLEQYVTPPDVAANLLYVAAYINDSIIGKRILDLGCGTGRLALGAAFLGAKETVGIDIDLKNVQIAAQNAAKADLKGKTQWIGGDINAVCGRFDTVIQNPPFGIQKRGADTKFLHKALEIGNMVYSLHKHPGYDAAFVRKLKTGKSVEQVAPDSFLADFVEEHTAKIRGVYAMVMSIPHMFEYHTKKKYEFLIDLYVIETDRSEN